MTTDSRFSDRPLRDARRAVSCVASLLAAIVLSSCAQQASEQVETSAAVPVSVEAVRRGDIRAFVTATGVVVPAPGADLIVTAPQPARIGEIPKAEGDRVRNGDLLVRFQIPSLDADSAARRAEVTKTQARFQNAKAALARATDLFDRGVAARKEVEDAQRDLADAEAAVGEAEAGVRATATLASRAEARASFDGVVAKRWHNPGDLVDAASTDPVLRVIDPRHLEIQAAVPASDLTAVMPGADVRIFGPAGGTTTGTVVNRPVTVDPSSATAFVRIALHAGANVATGTPVRVEILAGVRHDALILPSSALVLEGTDTFVYVVGADNKAHRRPVVVALVSGREAQIQTGVAAGDRVITKGQAALPDGAAVAVDQ